MGIEVIRDAWEARGDWRDPSRWEGVRGPIVPEINKLVDGFQSAGLALSEFRLALDSLMKKHPHWGFSGFCGQMYLNQLVKYSDHDAMAPVLRAAFGHPISEEDARDKIRSVIAAGKGLTQAAVAAGSKPLGTGCTPYLLTFFWEAREADQWPIFYPESRKTFVKEGLYSETGDIADRYTAYRSAFQKVRADLGVTTWELESTLFHLAGKIITGPGGGSEKPIHLLLKWAKDLNPDTMHLHRAVADAHGAVWWGRWSKPGATTIAEKWIQQFNEQVAADVPTWVFFYGGGSLTRGKLLAVQTETPPEPDLIPSYYDPDQHHSLWVKVTDFTHMDVESLTTQFVLQNGGKTITSGGLGNQTPLILVESGTGGGVPDTEFTLVMLGERLSDKGINLPAGVCENLLAAITAKKHVILTGAPGTAKTTLALITAELAAAAGKSSGVLLTTATADWTTYDTIGGLRPTANHLLEFSDGHFLEAIRKNKWLVIDELNRSNFDRAFGQLFTVLSGQAVTLPYERGGRLISVVPPGATPPNDTDPVEISPEWRIVATMNVFDKSLLFEMSYALMRRFAFIEVPSPSPAIFKTLIKDWATTAQGEQTANDFLAIRDIKDLGPAIFRDIAQFASERSNLGATSPEQLAYDAFYAYVLPQFEGVDDQLGQQLFQLVGALVGPDRRERLKATLDDVLGLKRLRWNPGLGQHEQEIDSSQGDTESVDEPNGETSGEA